MPTPDAAEFRILGPLEVGIGKHRLELGGTRQQVVLAMLLLSTNDVVSVDRLAEAIYGEDLPPTARSQVQISISALRRLLAAHGAEAAIDRQAQGYVLQIGTGRLDSRRFEELVAVGRAARGAGRLDQAATNYRDALRLWRGPALEGIDSLLIRAAAARLDEQRAATIEDRLALELDLGRHHELVGELTELAWRYPLRERLRGQLMLALYRCGRTAEALAVYQQTRRMMIDELGLEPGAPLQRLEHDIIAGDPGLDPPYPDSGPVVPASARRRVPRLLPADIADFIDRAEQVSQIHRRLTGTGQAGLAVPVVVITGQGGVGKTSLAVHAAHGVAGSFGDGQLFADLHSGAAHPVGPMQVLERFLRALGVPGPQIPDGLDERAEAYRDLLADRRVLVVLDDATSERQVTPLLPGSSSAAVLVTSRSRLAGLAGATRIEANVLDAAQSLDLLGRIAGLGRVQAQAAAAAAVARQCGHLPLALRIAGARLAAQPHRDIQQLADRLADQTRRLDELEHGELGVRASISLSYQGASEQARVLLRRLALLEAPVFSGWVAAALLDRPPADTEDVLDELVSAHLVEASGLPGQYRFHELIGVFARERLAAEEPAAERMAALERVLATLLYLADQARHHYYGGSYLPVDCRPPGWPLPSLLARQLARDPVGWYEQERAALISGVRQAAAAGLVELCWSLATTAEALFEARSYLDDWREVSGLALQATRACGDVRGQAAMLYCMGSLYQEQGRFEAARREFDEATALFADAGDDYGLALVIRNIAFIDRVAGRLGEAVSGYEQALAIFREAGDQVAVAYVLQSLARGKLESGEPGPARELLAEALRLTQQVPCGKVEAQVLYAAGEIYLQAGDLAEAASMFERALAQVRDNGDETGMAYVLRGFGIVLLRQGELGRARAALERARELAEAVGVPLAAARALLGLSELALARGDPAQAVVTARQAATAFGEMGIPLREAEALTLLAEAHRSHGDAAAAEATSARVAALRRT
jgi:DNA-binding SARP family transcriptional activator/Tfp pilus assembly protein PilF